LPQRSSRKRGAGTAPGRATAPAGTPDAPASAKAATPTAERRAPTGEPVPDAPRLSRTQRRDAEARAGLEPLAPGERPKAVTIATIVSFLLGLTVVVGYASGARVGGEGSLGSAIFLAAIFFVAAGGMWQARYWAVLGFEALLAFQIIVAALSLTVASNWWAALLCAAVIVLGGWLFWKLVRAMARIQMPERRPAP
jgi:hypothetical protein